VEPKEEEEEEEEQVIEAMGEEVTVEPMWDRYLSHQRPQVYLHKFL